MSEPGFCQCNDIRRVVTENGGESLKFVDHRASIDKAETSANTTLTFSRTRCAKSNHETAEPKPVIVVKR